MEKRQKYFEALGRRKTSVARVRLYLGEKYFLVNQKPLENYFPTLELQKIAKEALERVKSLDKFGVSALINGGGIHSQAEALRHAIARALVNFNPDFKKDLKEAGFLKRDPRMRERKKFGLKRARRAPQWQKR
jgi:small subunit ribosomal protein S9